MKLYKENRNTRNRKILAAVLGALIMGAALSPASLAAETRDSRPHCPVCPQGYLSEQRDYTDYNFPQKLLYCPLWH